MILWEHFEFAAIFAKNGLLLSKTVTKETVTLTKYDVIEKSVSTK